MNRHAARMLMAAGVTGAAAASGCMSYRDLVDPCWPERYNHTARREVVDAFAPQVQNGQVLDQTVWNYMFVAGTDELNGYGKYKLDYLIRRRPAPDPNIFVQTAHDVVYSPQQPERVGEIRRQLDLKRVATIRQYLTAQMVGRPMAFDIAIHDPFEVGGNAAYASGSSKLASTAATSGVLGSLSGPGGQQAGGYGTSPQQSSAAQQQGAPTQQQQPSSAQPSGTQPSGTQPQ